jgi:hypothetical protein
VATTQTTEARPIPLSPGDWRVDPARSELGFLTRMFGLIAVRGRYSGFDGDFTSTARVTRAGSSASRPRRSAPESRSATHTFARPTSSPSSATRT